MARRRYNNTSQPTSLTAPVSNSLAATTIDVVSTAGFPAVPFTIAIDRGTADEEAMLVSSVTATSMTGTRAYDSTSAKAHLAGASIEHTLVALDLDEANAHIEDTARDDHTQYLNVARLTPYLPEVFDTATITDIAVISGTYTTHALMSIASAAYDRLIKVEGVIPLALVPDNVAINGRILRDGSDVVARGSSFGVAVGGIPLQTGWIAVASGASPQFRFQVNRSSGSGGATEGDADYNNFTAMAVRDL